MVVYDQELDRYIDRIKQSNKLSDEDFVASLSRQGMTLKEYRADLRRDILKQRLINQKVKKNVVISDAEVEQYYKAHYDQFQNMDEVNMMAIIFKG